MDSGGDPKLFGDISEFSSREIYIETTSGSIYGALSLYDLLYIKSVAGDIDVFVSPQPVLKEDPKPAQLTLSTVNGRVNARLPINHLSSIPDRDYRTRMNTKSGDIEADIVIGTEAVIKSISGALAITALPTSYENSVFTTETESGDADILVLSPLSRRETYASPPGDFNDRGRPDISSDTLAPPLWESKQHLSRLVSRHEGISGHVKMQYPSVWEGEISAEAISGSIKVGGEGVRIVKDSRKHWVYHEVVAQKGSNAENASSLRIQEVSGGIDVWVGENCEWCKD
jgi:DUF4097 and DUF4098 domain-containing protein YvlB